jgi:hypothetical protein
MSFGSILFVAFLALLSYIAFWHPAREWNAYLLLKQVGIDGTATVLHLFEGGGRGRRYYVKFQLDGNSSPITQQLGYEKYSVLRNDAKVTVRYLPYNPKIARLWNLHEDPSIRNNSTIFAAIVMLIFPPLILVCLVIYLLDRIWIVYRPRS